MQVSSLASTYVDLSQNRADYSHRLVTSSADLRKIRRLIWKQNEKPISCKFASSYRYSNTLWYVLMWL